MKSWAGRNRSYLAALATVVVVGGGYAASACSCVVPIIGTTTVTTTTTTTTTGGATANIKVATTGNDGSCTRHSPAVLITNISDPCKTLDRANSFAQGGDTVAVMGGTYPDDGQTRLDPATDSLLLISQSSTVAARTSDVTFVCGDNNTVTNVGRYLLIESKHITLTGSCFNFRKVIVGDFATGYFGSPSAPCNNITLNGINMTVFDILAPCNTDTVSNSNIGPSVACYAPTNAAQCKANGTGSFGTATYTGEQYFVNRGIGNDDCCTEPKVHNGGCSPPFCTGDQYPQNVTITGNQFYGFSSRDPDGVYGGGPHAGCLWLGYGNAPSNAPPLTVSNNTFNQCMTYDIHVDLPFTPHIVITGNTFTPPKDAIRLLTNFSSICTLPCGGGGYWVEIEVKCQNNQTLNNYTITGNTFTGSTGDAKGYDLNYGSCPNPSYPGLVINSNTLQNGAANNPSQPRP